jgi:hypothetical protein
MISSFLSELYSETRWTPFDIVFFKILKCFVTINYADGGVVIFLKHRYNRYATVKL